MVDMNVPKTGQNTGGAGGNPKPVNPTGGEQPEVQLFTSFDAAISSGADIDTLCEQFPEDMEEFGGCDPEAADEEGDEYNYDDPACNERLIGLDNLIKAANELEAASAEAELYKQKIDVTQQCEQGTFEQETTTPGSDPGQGMLE